MADARKEIRSIDNETKEKEKTDFYKQVRDNIDNYVDDAEKKFGLTHNYQLAGYITTKGTMLDFSEGTKQRTLDHREISEVLDMPENAEYSDGLIAFVNSGNIRMNAEGIEIANNPNEKQINSLRGFFNSLNGKVNVDFVKDNGDVGQSVEYSKGTSATRILNDIDRYYKDGTIPKNTYNPLSDFLYQDRNKELTNREILATALKTTAVNDIERNKITEYQKNIEQFNELDKEYDIVNGALKELYFSAGKKQIDTIKDLQKQADSLIRRINGCYEKLL